MNAANDVKQLQLLARIWSDREQKKLTVQIEYSFRQEGCCRIYTLGKIETLD